jgi:hypothetical protein
VEVTLSNNMPFGYSRQRCDTNELIDQTIMSAKFSNVLVSRRHYSARLTHTAELSA